MSVALSSLLGQANRLLQPEKFQDYCPNGLQVEGKPEVKKLVSGVTASLALIDAAIERGADAILVHHGYFWRGEDPCISGMKGRRIRRLLQNEVSLLAYHLPLDAHPELGNNAQLAKRLGLIVDGGLQPEAEFPIGNYGRFPQPMQAQDVAALVSRSLDRKVLLEAVGDRPIQRVAWCTGGAQGYLAQAAALGVDCYLTGEVSEQTIHEARELGLHFIAAGHHATERYGAPAVADHLAACLGIEHEFIDIDNPA
ncbi:dinuclear metal center YbgI/SA1388 family protein [Litorivivens lipolytica]|uniref:GTP cyclohydrolase 1 type 2 homolog n=1 Tax=Litorivivens lipolytica TaxID=1524264 RepID=A0A7W4W4D2_9GAMM|nr:Nif3-like dinuclear metal center hexameric protein [Litorivivens lipolytica]MBB3047100.1 dinuclear metal center YbgI/SA1388 family protein [Litorivivens lipolytica]